MSNVTETLSVRGFKLASILDKKHGGLELILKVLDLENALTEAREALSKAKDTETREDEAVEFPDTIKISEFATMDGFLCSPPDEKTWIETLSHRTKLDIRAILSELPTEVGLYRFVFVHKKSHKLLYTEAKVWVIPVREGD